MAGEDVGPDASDGNLAGCGGVRHRAGLWEFDYGYAADDGDPEPPANTAPVAKALTSDEVVRTQEEIRLDARDSDDAETPRDLQYSWDFGDGGTAKDSTEVRPTLSYAAPGRYTATLTVTDPSGASDTDTVVVLVRKFVRCQATRVTKSDSWTSRSSERAEGGDFCFTPGQATMRLSFSQPAIRVQFGKARAGGTGVLVLDGEVLDRFDFSGSSRQAEFGFGRTYNNLGGGSHTLVLRVRDGAGYVDHFVIGR